MKRGGMSYLATAVVIGFCGALQGYEVFLTDLKGMVTLLVLVSWESWDCYR